FGAPSGDLGAPNGAQSGSESRTSKLILPLNCALTLSPVWWSLARIFANRPSPPCRRSFCPSLPGLSPMCFRDRLRRYVEPARRRLRHGARDPPRDDGLASSALHLC